METKTWIIKAYETSRGEKPVEEFIKSQEKKTQARISQSLDLLEEFGPYLSMPQAKKIEKDLYELRIRGKNQVRILYSFKNGKIFLLHAFKKKAQKIPSKELGIVRQRLRSI